MKNKIQTFSAACGILFLSIVLTAVAPALASPWPREPGEVLTIASVERFNAEDDDLQQTRTNTYFELGLPGRLTLGGQFAYCSL